MKNTRFGAVLLAAILALSLAGCGGGSSQMPEEEPPTVFETALSSIKSATTAEAAQAAYDEVKNDVTASQGDLLQAAVAERVAALETAARAEMQLNALKMAAGAVDTSDLMTADDIAAAQTDIDALQAALDAAVDVSDADKAEYQSQLTAANTAVGDAQDALDLRNARASQMEAISDASTDLDTALGALTGTPTQAQIDGAQSALVELEAAIEAGTDLTDAEKASAQTEVATATGQIKQAKQALMAQQEAERKAREEQAAADAAAMASLAKALYGGIGNTPRTGHTVTIDSGTGLPSVDPADPSGVTLANQLLTADKKTAVAANHGWEGTRYTASGTGVTGTYEAVVYGNADDPTPGAKFSTEYGVNITAGVLDEGTTEGAANRVDSPRFDQSAGVKQFELGYNHAAVEIPGSYHGVSGTYSCVPGSGNTCAVRKVAGGFTLGAVAPDENNPTGPVVFTANGGTWTFKDFDSDDRVMSVNDTVYATYGWWLHTSDDGTLIASAFAADRGSVPNASIGALTSGTATYKGGAAGHYALRSSTGGTNDAGQFTADAMLEADFGDNTITGTIDGFMGGDGKARNWSVELQEASLSNAGAITNTATVWTIDETPGDSGGGWSGTLKDNGDDGVPKVATGTFNSTFGSGLDGRMVGSFGANRTDD